MVLPRNLAVAVLHQLHDRDRLVLPRNRVFLSFLDDLGLVDAVRDLVIDQADQVVAPLGSNSPATMFERTSFTYPTKSTN